jgi:hypothetical protein
MGLDGVSPLPVSGPVAIPVNDSVANDRAPSWAPPGEFSSASHGGIETVDGAPPNTLPPVAKDNSELVLTGAGFGVDRDVKVLFPGSAGPLAATPESVGGDRLTVRVPTGALSGSICVTALASPDHFPLLKDLRMAARGEVAVTITDTAGTAREVRDARWCDYQPLAFQSDRSGEDDIWLWAPAGDTETARVANLTAQVAGASSQPAWSPGPDQLTPPLPDSIRPHRPLLAFVREDLGQHAIWILDPSRSITSDGRNPSRLSPPGVDDQHPDWSPDGSFLTFDSDVTGSREVFVMNVVWDDVLQRFIALARRSLTPGQLSSSDPSWFAFDFITFPSVPIGYQIAFTGPAAPDTGDRLNHLRWLATPYPEASEVVTHTLDSVSGDDAQPAYSPNGTYVAFTSSRSGRHHIWLLHLASEAATQLTSGDVDDSEPAWRARPNPADLSPEEVWGRPNARPGSDSGSGPGPGPSSGSGAGQQNPAGSGGGSGASADSASRTLSLGGVRLGVAGRSGHRRLVLRLTVSRSAEARIRVRRGSRLVVRRRYHLQRGENRLELRLPRFTPSGRYKVTISIRSGAVRVTEVRAFRLRR